MTNEWAEFKAYTEQPVYAAEGKKDTRYLGRFTYKTLLDFEGFARILTTIARGYLYHDRDGSLLPGSAYGRVDHARCAPGAACRTAKKAPSRRWTFVNCPPVSRSL